MDATEQLTRAEGDESTVTSETSTDVEAEPIVEEQELKRLKRRIKLKHLLFDAGDLALFTAQAATILLAIFAAIPFVLSLFLGYGFSTVLSGSMSGAADEGSLVVTAPYLGEQLTVGAIVGVQEGGRRYLHRIAQVNDDGSYRTKGDANSNYDLIEPTAAEFWGVAVQIIPQPLAGMVTFFTLNTVWAEDFWNAVMAWDWSTVGELLPATPWGFMLLLFGVLLFWWLIPDLIEAAKSRAAQRDELALEALKLTVAGHGDSLGEIEPVVVELKQDHDAAKAEKEAETAFQVAAQESALEAMVRFDPEALYDEPEGRDDPLASFDAREFLARVRSPQGTGPAASSNGLHALPAPEAQSRTPHAPKQRLESSAFYFEEDE